MNLREDKVKVQLHTTQLPSEKLQENYDKAIKLLQRCLACFRKQHWEDGDTDTVVSGAVNDFLWDLGIEKDQIEKKGN